MSIGTVDEKIRRYVATLDPGAWLPSDADLAREFDISVRTMRRVMARLRGEGAIVRIKGKGTHTPYAGAVPEKMPRPRPRLSSAEELFGLLRESITRGELRRGDLLPQAKFIRLQHGVSDRTVREAYARLVEAGLVTKLGRRYGIGSFSPKRPNRHRRTVPMIVESPAELARIYTSYERSPAYRKLERELRANGFVISYLCRRDIVAMHRRYHALGHSPGGMIFFRLAGGDIDLVRETLYPFARKADGTLDFPVLVDLQSYAHTERVPYKLTIVSQGNFYTEQARSVADYFARSSHRLAVAVFHEPQLRKHPQAAFLRYFKMVYEIILAAKTEEAVALVLLSDTRSITPDEVYRLMMEKHASYLRYLDDKYGAKSGITTRRLHERLHVLPDFASILERFGTNVLWLCATDELTAAALGRREASSLAIPGDVSVVSLQNAPAYYHLSASACAPDWELIGYLMAHSIVGDFPLDKTSHGYLRVPCPLIHRSTTQSSRP